MNKSNHTSSGKKTMTGVQVVTASQVQSIGCRWQAISSTWGKLQLCSEKKKKKKPTKKQNKQTKKLYHSYDQEAAGIVNVSLKLQSNST